MHIASYCICTLKPSCIPHLAGLQALSTVKLSGSLAGAGSWATLASPVEPIDRLYIDDDDDDEEEEEDEENKKSKRNTS